MRIAVHNILWLLFSNKCKKAKPFHREVRFLLSGFLPSKMRLARNVKEKEMSE